MKTLLKNRRKKSQKKVAWNGVPATVRKTPSEVSLKHSCLKSLGFHFTTGFVIWAITFCLMFFGVVPKLFPPPKAKMKDIEFILSGHKSRHKAARSLNSGNKAPSEQNKIATPKNVEAKTEKVISKPSKNSVPDFAIPMPNLKSLSSGLGKSNKSKTSSSNSSSSQIGDINNAFSSSEGNGSGEGAGNGTSSGFNKNATKAIIAAYDISPYVNELKREIRWNWKAPSGSENKKVELFLRIAKDGRLIILNVKKTSETGEVDNAALNAVKKCLPLNPLPSKYNKSYLDVIFTFGSNSIGSRY